MGGCGINYFIEEKGKNCNIINYTYNIYTNNTFPSSKKLYYEIKNLTIKRGFAFVEFYDPKDAKYAIKELDGRKLFGQSNRIVVEEAKISKEERVKRKNRSRSREKDREDNKDRERNRDKDYYYKRRTGPKKTDICYNCGKEGHWANECHENRRNR